jgi:hypothetical protein
MMAPDTGWRMLLPWAGALLGPAFWWLNMQLGLILPYPECGGGFRTSILTTFLGVGASLIGAFVSYRASSLRHPRVGPLGFVGSVAALLGVVFAFAQILQAASVLVLTGCER